MTCYVSLQLGYITCLATIAFIRFYFGFPVLWLLYYTCSYPIFPLVFYSTCLLLLSYHTMSLPCLISFAVYLLAPACLCSRHGFQCMFMIRIYRHTCAYLCSLLGIHITTRRGALSDSPGSSCPGHGVWSVWILPVADRVAQLKRGSPIDRPEPHPSKPPARL